MKTILIVLILSMSGIHAMSASKNTKSAKTDLSSQYVKALGFGGQKFTRKSSGIWTLAGGVTIYSTEAYSGKIRGYAGSTPLFMAVSDKGKIISIVAAPNMETPEYFEQVLQSKLLTQWNGKTLAEAATFKPDIVTGATYSSYAVIRTVNATAKHLSTNK